MATEPVSLLLGAHAADAELAAATAREWHRIFQEARTAWPQLEVEEPAFAAHVARHLAAQESPAAALQKLHGADLYLAFACVLGQTAALEAFDARFLANAAQELRKLNIQDADAQDLKQRIRQRLLLANGDEAPRVAQYQGRGPLEGFVRVVMAREGLKHLRKDRPEIPSDNENLFDGAVNHDGPETQHLKTHYRAEFKAAFEQALTQLQPQERNVLRHHFVDGLSIDQIGAIYSVHRATAARWLARTRETLLNATRDGLRTKLKVDQEELASIFRLIESHLDASISRFLKRGPE